MKKILVFVLAFLVALMPFAIAEEAVDPITLAEWNGSWNNALLYFDHEQVQKAFTEIAGMTGMSADETEAMFTGMFRNEFTSLIITDDTIAFYDTILDAAETEQEPVAAAVYQHMGTLDNGMHLFYSSDDQVPYPYFGLYGKEVDETGTTMTHFHSRYGNSVADLMTANFWYPTFVPFDTEDKAIYNGFMEFAAEQQSGSETIEIATAEGLLAINNNLSGHYVLTADIDLSEYENWQPIGAFQPLSDAPEDAEIPHPDYAFTGRFDGNGHTISNLTITSAPMMGAGLFGCASGTEQGEGYIGNFTNTILKLNIDISN